MPPTPDYIDVLDDRGKPTGEVLSRKEIHALGKLHRAVHLYVFDSKNRLLLQRRAPHVDHYPNWLSISVTGHVNAGERSTTAVQRELQEELGIALEADRIVFLFSYRQDTRSSPTYIDRQYNDVYACWLDIDSTTITLDPNEVSEVLWVPFTTFTAMVQDPASGLAPVYEEECARLIAWLSESGAP